VKTKIHIKEVGTSIAAGGGFEGGRGVETLQGWFPTQKKNRRRGGGGASEEYSWEGEEKSAMFSDLIRSNGEEKNSLRWHP